MTVAGSPASPAWLDVDAVQTVTGRPVPFEQRDAHQARGPRPAAVVACPLTMNSGSKVATGITDTYATGVLVDAIATRTPLTIVVMVSNRLWPHSAWTQHLGTLEAAGALFVDAITGMVGEPQPVMSGMSDKIVADFDALALARVVGPPSTTRRSP